MGIRRFSQNQVTNLYTFLKAKKNMIAGLTKSYIWEITSRENFMGIYRVTKDPDREPYGNIFFQYGQRNGHVIEEWNCSDSDRVVALSKMINKFGPKPCVSLCDSRTGEELGYVYVNRRLEMSLDMPKDIDLARTPNLARQDVERVVDIIAYHWWTAEQARRFVTVANSNPSGISKVIRDGERAIAFGHAVYDNGQAYIIAVLVDEAHRRKGNGRKITESILSDLRKRNINKVNLCVVEDNKDAIDMYQDLGFAFTDFVRYRFKT